MCSIGLKSACEIEVAISMCVFYTATSVINMHMYILAQSWVCFIEFGVCNVHITHTSDFFTQHFGCAKNRISQKHTYLCQEYTRYFFSITITLASSISHLPTIELYKTRKY